MKKYLQKLGQDSYKASLERVDTKTKNKVLLKFSYLIKKNLNKILSQNRKDIKYAKINMVEIANVIFNPKSCEVSYSSFSVSKYIIFIILK